MDKESFTDQERMQKPQKVDASFFVFQKGLVMLLSVIVLELSSIIMAFE